MYNDSVFIYDNNKRNFNEKYEVKVEMLLNFLLLFLRIYRKKKQFNYFCIKLINANRQLKISLHSLNLGYNYAHHNAPSSDMK